MSRLELRHVFFFLKRLSTITTTKYHDDGQPLPTPSTPGKLSKGPVPMKRPKRCFVVVWAISFFLFFTNICLFFNFFTFFLLPLQRLHQKIKNGPQRPWKRPKVFSSTTMMTTTNICICFSFLGFFFLLVRQLRHLNTSNHLKQQ